jgi:hypothetical protein
VGSIDTKASWLPLVELKGKLDGDLVVLFAINNRKIGAATDS